MSEKEENSYRFQSKEDFNKAVADAVANIASQNQKSELKPRRSKIFWQVLTFLMMLCCLSFSFYKVINEVHLLDKKFTKFEKNLSRNLKNLDDDLKKIYKNKAEFRKFFDKNIKNFDKDGIEFKKNWEKDKAKFKELFRKNNSYFDKIFFKNEPGFDKFFRKDMDELKKQVDKLLSDDL